LRLRRRLWHLRRLQRSQLDELAGLAVELRRLDSPRYQELADARLESAAATDREILALERELAPEDVGGKCPGCGLHSRRTRFCLRCGERLPGRHRFEPVTPLGVLAAVAAIAAAWVLGGTDFGGHSAQRASSNAAQQTGDLGVGGRSSTATGPRYQSVVAKVRGSSIDIYHSKGSSTPYTTLSNPNALGAQRVFLVKKLAKNWARVLLPTRPNGSEGWIKLSKVKLTGHSFRVRINLDKHRLTVWNARKVVLNTPIGVGRAVTPTPTGLYYITELLKQPDPNGTYGPYAFGLSVHSNVLNEFAGGDGQLGLHGTNFPQGIGTNVSHGCIRMSNAAITKLAHTLPAGTPVTIMRNPTNQA
jgi:lipoprotein-anchoring transpeptidase ErfK/SrfK